MARVFEVGGFDVPAPPWERMGYDEAMLRYGSDRPDRRFGLEIVDLSDALARRRSSRSSRRRSRRAEWCARSTPGRSSCRGPSSTRSPRPRRRPGPRAWCGAFVEEDGELALAGGQVPLRGRARGADRARSARAPGDLLLAVADRAPVAASVLGMLRMRLALEHDLVPAGVHDPLWVVDFPMFERDEATGRWDPLHHPFTAPEGDLDDPGALRSRAYDLVVDGWELGGGSIRINRRDVQERVLELLGIGPEEAQERFGFLLDALRYGAPPHGGIAMGLDRIVAIVAGRPSIRDVIAFPKTATGADPLTGAPAPVDDAQLRELGLALRRPGTR